MHRLSGPIAIGILLCVQFCMPALSQTPAAAADMVKAEFLHAWNAYKQYAWGHDAVKPLSKQPHDWYGTSLCLTPVDAYDLMLLMGLANEAAETKQLIMESFFFCRDIEVPVLAVYSKRDIIVWRIRFHH